MRLLRMFASVAIGLGVLVAAGCKAPQVGAHSVSQSSTPAASAGAAAQTVSNATASTSTSVVVSEGASHSETSDIEGTNLDFTGVAEPYSDTSVLGAVASLSLGTIRYPGGAIANYWNWQTGSVDQPPSTRITGSGSTKYKPGRQRTYGFTLSTLKRIITATGAVPIFDLNVMTSTLNDQLQMLETAAHMGLPIRYVELGNEFYLSDSNYLHAFPTPTTYADLVASWAPVIHAHFPNVQIAAVGTVSNTTPREQSWNSTLLNIAGNDINAVTLHDYPPSPTPGDAALSPSSLLASVSVEWQPVDAIINALPSHISAWLTEYNLGLVDSAMGSPPVGTTWEHALYIAQLDLEELESPRVTLTDFWDLFGEAYDAQFTLSVPPVVTPTGSASQLINHAILGATSVTPLNFANDPILDGSVDAVSGIRVTRASGGDESIFVNLGTSTITLATGSEIPIGASAQQLSAPLSMQAVHVQSLKVSTHLTLPPYSITVVTS